MKDIKDLMDETVKTNPEAFVDGDANKLNSGAEITLPLSEKTTKDIVNTKSELATEFEKTGEQIVSDDNILNEQQHSKAEVQEQKEAQEKEAEESLASSEISAQETASELESPNEAPTVQEGVKSDVVNIVAEGEEVEEVVIEEPSFFARNWIWLGALAGGAIGYAASQDDDEPIPVPTLSISDNQVNASEATFTVSGTADKNASVAVTAGGLTKNVSTDINGAYTVTFTASDIADVGQGDISVSVTSNRNGGRVSETSSGSLQIDTINPDAPSIDTVATDNVIAASEVTSILVGNAEGGSTLALTIAGDVKSIVVSDEGTWSYTLTSEDVSAMEEGEETLTLSITDNFGNVSATTSFIIQVDTIAPIAPTITDVTADNVINGAEQTTTLSGTAEANAAVTLSLGGLTKSLTADADGAWSYDLTEADVTAMGEGAEDITISATDAAGNTSTTTTKAISVDTVAPTAPTIADVTADNVINGAEQTTTLSGTAEANAAVTLSLGGLTKSLTADVDGAWSYDLTAADVTAMGEGAEDITISATDAAGNTSTTTTKAISVDTVAPTAPTITDVTADNVINGAEQTTTLSGTAEANAAVTLSLGGLTKSLTADADGAWSYDLTEADVMAMGEGAEDITISATDAAGNTSTTTTKAISVDTVAPTAPTIADVTADNVINGAEQTTTLSGTAEANAAVTLSLGGLTKSLTADADGAWSYDLTAADVTAMGEGAEDITITATDAAGNSSTTTTKAISVDTVAPTIVSIEADSANQQITLTYSADLDDVNAIDTSAFNVVTGNNTNEVVSATVSGAEVILVLTDAFAAGAAIVVGYTDAAGDQATSVQDNAGNDVDTFSSGVVADGYIRGAQIYLDANANGLADADELVTGVITDGLGNFVLSASDNPNGYAIIATGGVNIDTGLPNNTALKAPAGSSVINPITTLIQTVLENNEGTSLDDAKASVNAALGVSTELDLTKFDPISSLNAADNNATEALTVQKAATQVVAIIELATQGKTATEVANDSQTIINNLVDQIVTTETAIDFTDTAVVTSAVTEVTSTLEVADIVQVTQTLQAATSFDEVSQAQAEAFDDISPDAVKSISFDELTKDNTPNVTVTFDVADVSGKAAVSGDTITIEASQGDTTISTEVTLSASNIAQGSVSTSLEDLVDGTYTIKSYITDRVGNTSVVKTEESSLTVDSTSPTVLVTIDDTLVNASDRATVTFTFSEDPLDSISIDDLVATGGTLSNFEGAGTSRTVTFTPNADVEVAGSVSVIAQSYNDKIGNLGVSGSVIANVDSKAPTVTITSAQNSLKAGESTLVTMTFTEAPNADLSLTDFTVTGGILSELTIVDDVAQATFTPEENMEGTASITLAANSFSDLAGNPVVLSNSLDIKVDTQAASLTTELLSAAENSTSVGTIETSETATVTLGTGEDSDLFTLVDGALTLKSPQDFESEQTEFKVAFDLVDAAGNSSSDTMTVNITDVNEAPTVTSIADQIAVVGQAFSLDVKSAFTDVDAGDDLTYSIMGTLPDGIIFEDGVLSGIASTDTEASNITVTATDKSGLSISQDIAISAVSAPVILSIDVTQGDSDIAKTGESLTITATVSEVFTLNLNEATPTLTITLGDEDVVATYASHDGSAKTVTFTATAPGGDSSTVIVKSISLGAATLIGDVSAQPLAFGSVGQSDNEFELDNTAPTAPTITDVTADNVINGAEQTTTLSGTAEANAAVTLSLGGLTKSLTADADGVWSYDLTEADVTAMGEGAEDITISATDAAGNTSTTTTKAISVDTVAPTAPTITDVTADNVINGAEQTTTLSGTAEANAAVTLSLGGLTKSLTADADGVWSYDLTEADVTAMGEGAEDITISATDAAGNTSTTTTKAISVDTVAPTAPTITDVTADNVINGAEQTTTLSGTAEANAAVTLSLGGLSKSLTADVDGAWSYDLTAADVTAMGEGAEDITISATDAAGNTSTTTTKAVSVDTVAPTAPTITDVTADNVINGAEQTTTLSGTAEANAAVTLSLGGLSKSLTADVDGAWSYDLTAADVTAMGEGAEDITIIATDAAGNTSTTTTKAVSVDTVAPTAPTITDVTADNVINGAEQTTTLSGTAEANAAVTLSLGGLTKSLTADVDGAWSYDLTAADVTAMGEGAEDISITATDAAGNATMTTKSILVDTQAASLTTESLSAAENSTSVGTIETSETATVTLGTGEDSDLFTLVDGVLTLNSPQDFESEETEFTVAFDLVDAAGNTSSDTMTVNITDVNEAPTVTSIADQIAVVGQAFSLDVKSAFTDVDAGNELTFTIDTTLPEGITFVDGILAGTFTSELVISNLAVTATDKDGLSVSTTFDVDVVSVPVITTALSELGNKMLDVRSDIVLQVNQAVTAVSGKTITFTDNEAEGYQGETKQNSFTIDVTSDLVTIDNENGLIIVNVDEYFDLDLSSSYTLSIDDGAFLSSASGLASGAFADVTFETVTPTSGADSIANLGQLDEVASQANFFENKWLIDWLADDTVYTWRDTSTFEAVELTNQQAFDLIGIRNLGTTEITGTFASFTAELLRTASDAFHDAAEDAVIEAYDIFNEAAQAYVMSATDGTLVESAQWVDIEGLGIGTTSGTVASLADDIETGNVFRIDASGADYVFVFSDKNPSGGDENVGAGLETNTDFSVFLDEFGAGDKIYVDDAFNDPENLNVLAFEVFASGNGSENAELYLGLTGGDGDPRLYVGLEDELASTDEEGNADSSLEGVNNTLGLDVDDSSVITA